MMPPPARVYVITVIKCGIKFRIFYRFVVISICILRHFVILLMYNKCLVAWRAPFGSARFKHAMRVFINFAHELYQFKSGGLTSK